MGPLDQRAAWSLLILYCGLAAVLLRYHGLQHDAQAYVLQALASRDPTVFAGDLFLRFGSQDSYTLFSNFTALWISALGIDHGAAALTATSLLLFHVSVWVLVRTLVGSAAAWIAVGMMVVVPGWYGSGSVFQVAERFLSARLPAEALCLFALAAVSARRHLVAALLFILAAITHPLMTVPAICIVIVAETTGRYPALAVRTIGIALLSAVMLAGVILGWGDPLMRGDWLTATRARSDFLFLDLWELADWRHLPVMFATLMLAANAMASGPAKRIVGATLLVAIVGLGAAAIVSWGPAIKWVIQAQTWRWAWPATVLAIGLLPATLLLLNRNRGSDRCPMLLLTAAWILATADRSSQTMHFVSIALAAFAVLAHSVWGRVPSGTHLLWIRASWLTAALAGTWVLSVLATEALFGLDLGGEPQWMQRVIGALRIPACGAAIVATAWFALLGRYKNWVAPAVAAAGAALLAAAAPRAWESWTTERFSPMTQQRFAPWRDLIDLDSEVFWPDQLQSTWFALGRRSYLSKSQLGGIVFSAETTAEARRRAQNLAAIFPPGQWFNETAEKDRSRWATSAAAIRAVCEVTDIDFVVANANFHTDLPPVEWPMPGRRVYLYACRDMRG
jgi:hypothetical protein